MDTRSVIVREARKWIGTPYHNCADVRGVGVDCGMLLVRVYVDLGLTAQFDPRPYSADWHLHRSDERYLGFVDERATEVPRPESGDICVFRWGRCYSHGGIVSNVEPLTIIHAFQPSRVVVEDPVWTHPDLSNSKRRVRFFSVVRKEDN